MRLALADATFTWVYEDGVGLLPADVRTPGAANGPQGPAPLPRRGVSALRKGLGTPVQDNLKAGVDKPDFTGSCLTFRTSRTGYLGNYRCWV